MRARVWLAQVRVDLLWTDVVTFVFSCQLSIMTSNLVFHNMKYVIKTQLIRNTNSFIDK